MHPYFWCRCWQSSVRLLKHLGQVTWQMFLCNRYFDWLLSFFIVIDVSVSVCVQCVSISFLDFTTLEAQRAKLHSFVPKYTLRAQSNISIYMQHLFAHVQTARLSALVFHKYPNTYTLNARLTFLRHFAIAQLPKHSSKSFTLGMMAISMAIFIMEQLHMKPMNQYLSIKNISLFEMLELKPQNQILDLNTINALSNSFPIRRLIYAHVHS